jgi:hypothetical protein
MGAWVERGGGLSTLGLRAKFGARADAVPTPAP